MTADPDPSDASHYRRRLYRVLAEESLSLPDRLVAALDVAREYLGVENGHVARIDRDRDRREVYLSTEDADGVVAEGEVSDLETSYCRVTLERESPLAVSDVASEPGWEARYAEHGVGCYLGVELTIGEETFGTLCFVDRDARPQSFTEAERSFAELVARSVERELASARYEDRLDEHREALDTRERRLERSERKYESLVETAPDAIVLVDTDTERLAEANAAAADLTGYEERGLVGTAWRELVVGVAPDDGVGGRLVERLVAAEGPVDSHPDGSPLRVRHHDGSTIPVEVSASHVTLDDGQYVQAVFRDVTERRERQRELRLKDRAIEEAQVGITIAEADEDEEPLVYANPEFARLTGYDRDAVLGHDCRLLQGERTDGSATAALGAAIAAGEPVQQEVLNYRADGTPFWNEVTVTPVHDADGEVTHFVGFQRDVTERKRRETLVSVLNRVLRHNLRNDMTVVGGYADMLAVEYDGTVAEAGTTIAETAEELVTLSEKARTLERVVDDPGAPEARDPRDVVDAVADRVRGQYPEADIAVRTAAAESVPPVLGTDRLERALFELVENAAQHAGAASTVRVVVATDEDGVTIGVSDDGPGLASNERAVLDGRSETPLEHGTGLGLWLANWIVTGIGGEIEVLDPEGAGTTLEVGLRTATQRAVEAGEPAPSAIGLDD